jgi:hypothetical protein
MSMTVRELMEMLQDMDQDAEVRLAHQPQWAFEYSVDQVIQVEAPRIVTCAEFDEMSKEAQEQVEAEADEGECILLDEHQEIPATVVYIGEGHQIGYLPRQASRELGWR